MKEGQTYIPGTKLYYWYLDRFLAARQAVPSADRRYALRIYRDSVDEHIAAAQEAIDVMRRGKRSYQAFGM